MPVPVWSHSLMVRTPAFHAGDTGFESRWDHMAPSSNGLGRQSLKLQMQSSNLAGVTVAIVQRLVHQIVALKIRVQFPVVTPGAGRIAAIAADCKSADFGLRWFESNPAHFTFACPRWLMVPPR